VRRRRECVGLAGVCGRICQLVGFKVLLDPGEPAEQLGAEDFRLGRRKVDRHDPRAGRRVLISHEELRLLMAQALGWCSRTAGGRFSLNLAGIEI
jgi:hypothetical protein